MGTPRRKSGVLAGEVEPYREWLLAQGYSSASVITLLRTVSQLGVWLQARGMAGTEIDPDEVRQMFAARRRLGRHGVPGEPGMGRRGASEITNQSGISIDHIGWCFCVGSVS